MRLATVCPLVVWLWFTSIAHCGPGVGPFFLGQRLVDVKKACPALRSFGLVDSGVKQYLCGSKLSVLVFKERVIGIKISSPHYIFKGCRVGDSGKKVINAVGTPVVLNNYSDFINSYDGGYSTENVTWNYTKHGLAFKLFRRQGNKEFYVVEVIVYAENSECPRF